MTKPLHGEFKRLKRCPYCQTKYSKHNSGSNQNGGKSSARHRAKQAIKKEIADNDHLSRKN